MKRKLSLILLAMLAAASASAQAQRAPAPAPSNAPHVVTADVYARKLLWDSKRRQIVALVADPSQRIDDRVLPGTLSIIDPASGAVVGTILLGEPPSNVVIDTEGVYLYVALASRGVVRRFRLADRAWDLDIPVSTERSSNPDKPPIRAMVPLPGKPGVLLVATGTTLGVFDNAAPRQTTLAIQDLIALHARNDKEITGQTSTTQPRGGATTSQVVHFTVNDKGIRAANTPASFRADGPLVFGGKVAANRLGVVFDLTRGTEIGRLTFDSRVTDGISVIDPASKSIYAVPVSPKQGSSEFRIVRYDMDQFIETSDMRLTVGNNVGRPNGAAVAWNDGLAIAGAKLFIVPVSLFRNLPPPARPDLKLRNSTTSVSAGGGATPVITIEPRKTLDGVIRLALQTEVLIYNRASKTLYAAVGAEATSYPNSIVAIDPQTGVIRATAAIRGVSSPLAFSTNGQILYAGSKDTAVINRINMKTGKVETPLVPPNGAVVGPPTASYVWRARSIVAVPGRSDLVAVLWKSGVDSIVVTYDGGEPRPLIVPAEPKLRLGMLFSGDSGKTIFATAEPRLNQHLIQRLEIQDRGVTAADAVPLNFSLSLNPQFFENGWLVDGTRVFRRTGASLRQTASLDVPDPNSAQGRSGSQYRVTTVDAAGSRAFVVTQGGENALNIVAYDMRTFQPHSAGRADGLSRVNLESGASAVFAGESLAIRTRSELILFPLATLKNVPAPSPIVDELAAGFRRIRINVNSIAGDLPRGRLLASATLQSGGRGNSLLTLDPSSGTIERAYYAGSNPNRIAVSADGKSAYVALDGESRIARVNLATGERDLLFDSPVKSYAKVTDLAVGPSGTLAAVSTDGTLALFDEGRRRGGTVDFPAFRGETNRVVFDESGTTLVAYGNTFSVFRVTPEGPVYTPPPQPPAQRPELRRNVLTTAQISGGLAYSPWGDILDVARDEVVSRFVLSAQYTTIDLRNGGQRIALDTKAGRAYIAAGGNKPLILVFDLKDHNLIGARELPMSGSVLSFVQCGPDELAFQTADAIYILHISTIPLR